MPSRDSGAAVLVPLPGGAAVAARSTGERPYWPRPGFGVYLCSPAGRRRLTADWTPTWRAVFVDWPPLGSPRDPAACLDALGEALRRAREGGRVEVACGTGRVRTGTALAALAALDGLPARETGAWVRHHYRPPGPLTPGQHRLVRSAAARAGAPAA